MSFRLTWLSPLWPLLFILVIAAGKRFMGERWWVTTWFVYLPPLLFLIPSLTLAALALLLRRWRALAGQVLVVLLGVWLLCSGSYRLPRPARRADLRVMTWNVMGLQGDPQGVLRLVREEAADLLLLQEVRRTPASDPVEWLLHRLPGWQAERGGDAAAFS